MESTTLQTENGTAFRDLNKNGRLDPYEDPRRPIDERVEDLLAQMTLEEKAGLMFHTIAWVNPDGSLAPPSEDTERPSVATLVTRRLMNHFNVHTLPEPRLAAEWYNCLQALAERTRLGIPVTISSDPRHAFSNNPATSFRAASFSQWPEQLGFAAIDDPALVEAFGDMARQEYLAVGIRVALHPMVDLATEPRWSRNNGTFGEDAELAARMAAAYIRGFQGATLGKHSVACMTKHFPGGGPQKDGEDPHFSYGKEQVYPGNNFAYHLIPFGAAFAAGAAQIMPYYGMPVGTQFEEVGFSFNKQVISGLLREQYGFDGIVCTDWALLNSVTIPGLGLMEAKAWGVEHLSVAERAKKALDAGVDQFGGEACPEVIVELVRSGQVAEVRIDQSARRLLREKFRLGLFDAPYVDVEAAARIVGNDTFRQAGAQAQRRSIVLLKNGATAGKILPLQGQPRIYIENIAPEAAGAYGQVVERVADADVAILRLEAPHEARGEGFEARFHRGDLRFKPEALERILAILRQVPTIVDIYLDRPAVIPEIAQESAALLANFGASDAAVLDVIFGHYERAGAGWAKLPFELPSSWEAVLRQKPDVPYDSENPLFPFGHGLSY